MINKIDFRLATKEDLPSLVKTYNASIPARMATADLEPVTVESKSAWFDAHQTQNRPLYILETAGNYCGWLSFSSFYGRPAYNETAELSIYLNPEYQGKGIGSISMKQAEKFALQAGIKTLLGFVFGHNEPSIRLFYRHGYEKWGHLPAVANMGGMERDLLILGKKIFSQF